MIASSLQTETRTRAARASKPETASVPQPEGNAAGSLRAQRVTAEARVRDARQRLDAAVAARVEADRARTASPTIDSLREQARQSRLAVEDAEADLVAFEGARDLLAERHAAPRVAELLRQHAAIEGQLAPGAVAARADALLKRAEKIAELLVALELDSRELHADVADRASKLDAIERELGIDPVSRQGHDYRLHRYRVAAALVGYATRKGIDRELLLAYLSA
jgi:hypothetical protein